MCSYGGLARRAVGLCHYARRPGRRRLVLVEVRVLNRAPREGDDRHAAIVCFSSNWLAARSRTDDTTRGRSWRRRFHCSYWQQWGSVVAFIAAHAGRRVSLTHEPIRRRLATVLVAYVRYLGKAVWPTHLAIFYSMPVAWPATDVVAAAAPSLRNHSVRLGRRKAVPVCACRLAVVRRQLVR